MARHQRFVDEDCADEEAASPSSSSDGEEQSACDHLHAPRFLLLAAVGAALVAASFFAWHSRRNEDGAAASPEATVFSTPPKEAVAPPAEVVLTLAPEVLSTSLVPTTTVQQSSQKAPASARCGPAEELLAGLCYRNCSLLTNGSFPLRWAPNACHKEATETRPAETKFSGLLCNGFDVGSDGQCPHPPSTGQCDDNEELHASSCYKTCELLTNGKYKIRSGPNTCCEEWPCFNPFRDATEGIGCQGFGVGGGMHGHHCPHPPE